MGEANPFQSFAFSSKRRRPEQEAVLHDNTAGNEAEQADARREALGLTLRSKEDMQSGPTKRHRADVCNVTTLKELMKAREGQVAPIDRYGTQACVSSSAADDRTKRFQLLVAAMLSSQTKDEVTFEAMQRLHAWLPSPGSTDTSETFEEGLSIGKVEQISEATLDKLLTPVGFHRRKAQYLKAIASACKRDFQSDIPRSLEQLISLPGVGPKIARVVLLLAWQDCSCGIIVDTHVHRVSQRLGWVVQSDRKTPEQTRKELEDWVPRSCWAPFSRAVVGFGQTMCLPTRPQCSNCPLARDCPSAFLCSNTKRGTLRSLQKVSSIKKLTKERMEAPL